MPQHRCLRATCSGSASGTSSGGASSWGWVRGSWREAHGLSSRRIVLGRTLAIDRNGRAESVTVVIAPDSFKGSAAAHVVAAALERGWRRVRPEDTVVTLPFADGGEGTLAAVSAAIPEAMRHPIRVTGPVGNPVDT